ncbi:MAG: hypothetical protein R2849_10155 [Thermomicrobiales bacterium]
MVVGWLGTVFRTGGNLGFSLLATGVVAVLFQPLRDRIQRWVNRFLYGERDEPYAVISRLGRRLEDTFVPDAVLSAIVGTVSEALRLLMPQIALSQGGEMAVAAAVGVPDEDPVRLRWRSPVGELHVRAARPGRAVRGRLTCGCSTIFPTGRHRHSFPHPGEQKLSRRASGW